MQRRTSRNDVIDIRITTFCGSSFNSETLAKEESETRIVGNITHSLSNPITNNVCIKKESRNSYGVTRRRKCMFSKKPMLCFRRRWRHPDSPSPDNGHSCLHIIRYSRLQLNRSYAAYSTWCSHRSSKRYGGTMRMSAICDSLTGRD